MSKIIISIFLVSLFFLVFFSFFAPDNQFFYRTPNAGDIFKDNLILDRILEIPMTDDEIIDLEEHTESITPVFIRIDNLLWSQTIEKNLRDVLDSIGVNPRSIIGIMDQLSSRYNVGVFSLEDIRTEYDGTDVVLLTDSGPTDIDLYGFNEVLDIRRDFSLWVSSQDIGEENTDIISSCLLPNIYLDDSARAVRLENNLSALDYIDTSFAIGDTLIYADEPISENAIRYLTYLSPPGMEYFLSSNVIGVILFLLFVSLIIFLYIKNFMFSVWKFTNQFLLLSTIWLVSLATTGLSWNLLIKADISLYATMVSFGTAFTCIFFQKRDGIFFSLVFALILGISHPHPFLLIIITSISGLFICFNAWDLTKRSTIPAAAAMCAIGGILPFLIMRYSMTSLADISISSTVLSLVIASIIGLGAVNVLLPIFEKLFGVYTVLSFVDINKADHKLLLALREKAPGTWNHSVLVSELAGQAAFTIKADDTLASAGGLFHDIGKISTPEYFIENQSTDESPHDNLTPAESAKKIISHVKNGVSFAKKAKLPQSVIEIIRKHHGTSSTWYFYNKAIESTADPANVDTGLYKYDGPKPDTLESAIVLLADQVASATKNITEKDNVKDVVKSVVDNIDAEGQLDDCQLTRRNLKEIEKVFCNILEGKLYKRIVNYPEGDKSVAD